MPLALSEICSGLTENQKMIIAIKFKRHCFLIEKKHWI